MARSTPETETLGIEESSLVVLPGPLSAAAEVDVGLARDGVADAALEGAQRLFLRLSFGDLALVVGPAGGVVADLGDGGQVKGVVELAVAARVEPAPRSRTTACAVEKTQCRLFPTYVAS
jgi:hypothetical protein